MVDMNMVIANNISSCLAQNYKKQVELAEHLGVSRQVVSKMLNGARTINAAELREIADFCNTSMENLTTVPHNYEETDVFHVFMGQVSTDAARQSIQHIDKMTDMILFHSKVKENGMAMRAEWSDL